MWSGLTRHFLPVESKSSITNLFCCCLSAQRVAINVPSSCTGMLPLFQGGRASEFVNLKENPARLFRSAAITLPPTNGSASTPIGLYSNSRQYFPSSGVYFALAVLCPPANRAAPWATTV